VNRQFFHPIGLALVTTPEDDKPMGLTILDCHADPEGVVFGWDHLSSQETEQISRRAKRVANAIKLSKERRETALGFWVQPLPVAESTAATEGED